MACFTVPAAEAVVTTIAGKIIKAKEKKEGLSGAVNTKPESGDEAPKISWSTKIGWLNKMLWGGSALLAFEHAWHGEIIPTFPFLTNAVDAADRAEMFHEMATVGVTMALLITAVWGIGVAVTILWYKNQPGDKMKISVLCYLYWGASLMWLVDAIYEYAELGPEFFSPAAADMINDAFLGLSAVAFGMVIWVVILLIKDPKGVIKAKLAGRAES